ncbi:FUSC family protein [Diaphorobacter aerolatus]|uniref:FUSC family protein n=1 Tax=Diaphorobacter aerolatus TaxID=1288495 RepID=A0A7H0GM76_9BURK|nr:FUSC family membrane protein [Diaphorobacter aerolatus]QNP49392.1 FUSC family protein [Diaphorobacter aerolatus]
MILPAARGTRVAIQQHAKAALRGLLNYYMTNGYAVALGYLLISAGVGLVLGTSAGAAAALGAVVTIPPDLAGPRRGKFRQMIPAPIIGVPLFFAVQMLHSSPLELGILIVVSTFVVFLAMAWGKRGAPIAIALMFAMIFSLAVPPHEEVKRLTAALQMTGIFALGAFLYVLYSCVVHRWLNPRYRVQFIADTLLSLADLMRLQARQFGADTAETRSEASGGLISRLLARQAALADQIQSTRDVVFESPDTPPRQRLAAMLLHVLDMRDHMIACALDLDTLKQHAGHHTVLGQMHDMLILLANETDQLADFMLFARRPPRPMDYRARLENLRWAVDDDAMDSDPNRIITSRNPSPDALVHSLADRIANLNDEVLRLYALARGEAQPNLAAVRASWHLFVSPVSWSLKPFYSLWNWGAPALRHAVRAALAIATAYLISLLLPWGTHEYWIFLTIVVVLRGSLAQTLERRNLRVGGTLLGCVLALSILSLHPGYLALILCLTVAQSVAHGLALRKYLYTAVAATVLGLIQAHMISASSSTVFALFERTVDTLLGAGIAWLFSYVLPSWERSQIPGLVRRVVKSQIDHVRTALDLAQLDAVDNAPELNWRLARKDAYDSLTALVLAAERSLKEPRAVRPPLQPLELLQAHAYQMLAQLTAVKSLLLLRRGSLPGERLELPLRRASERMINLLSGKEVIIETVDADEPAQPVREPTLAPGPEQVPQAWDADLMPWLERRLEQAILLAAQVRKDADQLLGK